MLWQFRNQTREIKKPWVTSPTRDCETDSHQNWKRHHHYNISVCLSLSQSVIVVIEIPWGEFVTIYNFSPQRDVWCRQFHLFEIMLCHNKVITLGSVTLPPFQNLDQWQYYQHNASFAFVVLTDMTLTCWVLCKWFFM